MEVQMLCKVKPWWYSNLMDLYLYYSNREQPDLHLLIIRHDIASQSCGRNSCWRLYTNLEVTGSPVHELFYSTQKYQRIVQ